MAALQVAEPSPGGEGAVSEMKAALIGGPGRPSAGQGAADGIKAPIAVNAEPWKGFRTVAAPPAGAPPQCARYGAPAVLSEGYWRK
jgi:hypothetical protein